MKRFLSVFLSLSLALSCSLGLGITANAAEKRLPIEITNDGTVGNTPVVRITTAEDFKAVYNALDLYKQAPQFEPYSGHVSIMFCNTSDLIINDTEKTKYNFSNTSFRINTDTDGYRITIGENVSIIADHIKQSAFSSDIYVNGRLSIKTCELYRNLYIGKTGIFEVTQKNKSKVAPFSVNPKEAPFVSFSFKYFENNGIMRIANPNVFSSKGETCVNNGTIYTPDKQLYDTAHNVAVSFTGTSTGGIEQLITNELSPDNDGNAQGDTPMGVNGTAISQPGYTVTIPKTVEFGDMKKTNSKNIVTKELKVSANGVSNLFANQQKLVVTVSSKNNYKLSDGATKANMLGYNFYTSYTDETTNTPVSKGLIFEAEGAVNNDTNLTVTINGVVSVNTAEIKKAGTYTDILTFTVALQEVSA